VFELIRLVQADAEVRALERVFKGEPLLAYLLLTLANSAAFRRPTPVSSLGHAISLLGYQRLIKWLVLLLAIAGKNQGTAPLIHVAVVRGQLLENLCAAAGRPRLQRDEGFIVGTFSLLDAITASRSGTCCRTSTCPVDRRCAARAVGPTRRCSKSHAASKRQTRAPWVGSRPS